MKKSFLLFFTVLLMMFFSCANFNAYFNIFYNAEKYYKLGIKPLEDDKPVDRTYLDKSIEKSSKILQLHQNSKYVDDALILIGKSYMYKGDYSKAIKKFTELIDYFPDSKYFEEALFYLGKTYLMQQDTNISLTIFSQVISKNGKFQNEVLKEIVNIYIERKDFNSADSLIENISYKTKNNPVNIFLKGKIKYLKKEYDTALKNLLKINVKSLPKDFIFDYYRYLIGCYVELEDFKNAEKYTNRAIDIFQNHDKRNVFYYLKVQILERKKEYEKSIKLIDDILSKRDRYLIDSLLFKKGYIYEKYFNDIKNAEKSYRMLTEIQQNSPLFYQAEAKSKSLQLLLSLQDENLELSDEEKVKNRFLLSEIEYFFLEKTEDAIKGYKNIIDSFPLSYYSPKSLFALSYIYLKDYNDTLKSIEFLEKIVNDYPSTEFYLSALKRIKELKND
ncbi:MAG: tetratricopeptide repeat protein [candidate division WOR-3 bacterium]